MASIPGGRTNPISGETRVRSTVVEWQVAIWTNRKGSRKIKLGLRETARPDRPTGLDHGPSNSSSQSSTLSTASRKKKSPS